VSSPQHSGAGAHVQHHFADSEQQFDSAVLGTWIFLVTEIMFFGGLFMAYILYRSWYPEAFVAGSHHLDIRLGAFNTVVLIGSSLTVVLSVRAAQQGRQRALLGWLLATIALGFVFLGVKAVEYYAKWEHHLVPGPNFHWDGPHAENVELFFSVYFAMTGLHALHMIIGAGLFTWLVIQTVRGRYSSSYYTPVECTGLYWHFVDLVWIYLFPLLYLIGRH
jgi:cytochrome c oxidase subunit 3